MQTTAIESICPYHGGFVNLSLDFEKHLVRKRRNVICVESEWIKRVRLVRIQAQTCFQNIAHAKKREESFCVIIRSMESFRGCLRVTVRAVRME